MLKKVKRSCWCGCDTAHSVFEVSTCQGEIFNLVQCDGCDLYCLYPAPDEVTLLRYYDTEYYGASPLKFAGPIARAIAILQNQRAKRVAKFVRQGGKILDIGCGNGRFLKEMKRQGYSVEGTELTKASALRVSKEADLLIHIGDLLSLELAERSYDAVTFWHVIEHVRNPLEILRKVNILLKDNGILFLSLPNQDSWQAKAFGKYWFHIDPPRHLFGFGTISLISLLEKCGFSVECVNTFSLEYNPFGFMQSMLNSIGISRDRAYGTLKLSSSTPQLTKITDLLLLSMLSLPAIAFELLAGCCGAGATMNIMAHKR
ncbi:MAG: class I SAM-dependent methyltransferase [Proteobacteria bacterium]|nr:class I SAM-dependent methyltransferase [Pseudomonadota bacterium]MBU4036699.1 class I SAM-dependent methyltransferase [Pseudomonadota bacterium]